MSDSPVVFTEVPLQGGYALGVARLNAEKSLNALSLEMIELLAEQLPKWQDDPRIAAVWLEGTGEKAFCAGGNIVRLYESMQEHGEQANPYAERFFTQEYQVDYLIHTYRKPLICWGHGIVMGGGLGLMAGANFRVVTEKSRIAMPEISIGLYPDVGGTWFLNRMPGRTGLFMGLTSCSINASDALFLGLADRFIAQEHKAAVLAALADAKWQGEANADQHQVNTVLRQFEQQSQALLPVSPVREHYDLINQLMDHVEVADIRRGLDQLQTDDPWLQKAIKGAQHGSPSSAVLIKAQLERGRHWSLKETFQQELALSVNCCGKGEFREGVRALLIEKDNQPKWRFATVAEVDPAFIASYFVSPWQADNHPLAQL